MFKTAVPLREIALEVWDATVAEPRTPMRQYIWAQAYEETLARGDVRVMMVGSRSNPVALAPFAEPASGPQRQVLLGAEDLWESIEVAADDDKSLEHLAKLIADCGIPVRLGHHPTDTPFLEHLARACRGRAQLVVSPQPMGAMPRIRLDDTWAEPESHFSSRRRSDLRRMARKAAALGKVTFDIIMPQPAELDRLLDEAFDVEAQSWKGGAGTAIKQNHRIEAFYRNYARRAMEAGILRLCFMRIDGKAAAMQLAVEHENAFWLIKVGYSDAFKEASPGNLLMRETIRYAAQKGLKSYEFLGKEADWTQLWAGDARPIATVRTYPFNYRGLTAFLQDGIAVLQKRLSAKTLPFAKGNHA
jgi:CelD/BcsL family acetyltransferase involved in cellulose biosynthesis